MKRWTDEEIETLCRLRNKGVSYEEISKQLNRSISSCQTMRHDCKCRVDKLSCKLYTTANSK